MKAVITKITFVKEYDTKFGKMCQFDVYYDDKKASFSSKTKEQTTFKEGQENEFTEEAKDYNGRIYTTIKPIKQAFNSGYSREVKKEQSKYSGFAVSYVKDLIIAGKVEIKDWEKASEKIFTFMVNLDKSIQQ